MVYNSALKFIKISRKGAFGGAVLASSRRKVFGAEICS